MFETPHVRLVEFKGTLRLEKTAMDGRDIAHMVAIALQLLWAGFAALWLITDPPCCFTFAALLSFAVAPILISYDNLVVRQISAYRGSVVSVVRKHLWIGRVNNAGDGGYRDASTQGRALVVDGRPITAQRRVRVAVGEIDSFFFWANRAIMVSLVLGDRVVLVAQFDEQDLATELAARLGGVIDSTCDPAARTACETGKWDQERPWVRAAVWVDMATATLMLFASTKEIRLIGLPYLGKIVAGSLLVHLAIRHFVILKLARRRVEQSLLRAFGVAPTTVAPGPEEPR